MSLRETARRLKENNKNATEKTVDIDNMSIREIAKQVREGNNNDTVDEKSFSKKRNPEVVVKAIVYIIALAFIFGLVILVFVAGRSLYNGMDKMLFGTGVQEEIEKEVSTQPVYKFMLAEDLFREYEANKVAADERYKGKILIVQGVVKDIDKDLSDEIYVELIGAEYSPDNVRCCFFNTHKYEVGQLIKGQKVMIKGKCYGSPVGDVVLKGCIFL